MGDRWIDQRKEDARGCTVSVAYVAVYDDVNSALADLDVLGGLHDDELIGKYDAAVIDQDEGKPHIVKRVDHPPHQRPARACRRQARCRAASSATRRRRP